MLTIFLLTASLTWTAVLTFFVVRDVRLLLKVLRWSTSLYLICFGMVAAEVLREGLVVHGGDGLHWDVRLAWMGWFLLVVLSALDWRFLVLAVALPVWSLSYPKVRTLLNYGLVRLQWGHVVHSPLAWALGRPRVWELSLWGHVVAVHVGERLTPALRPFTAVLDWMAGWVDWTAGGTLEKLRPPPRWTWVPFTEGWLWRWAA